MKKNRFFAAIVGMMLATSMLAGCSSSGTSDAGKTDAGEDAYTIGIQQYAPHPSLDNCREGFIQGLAAEGLVEGENLTILTQNAQGDGNMNNQIAQSFVSDKVDLICGIATPSAQSAFNAAESKNIPVIYTAVNDPVLAGLAKEDGTPVGEVTGTSDELPVDAQLKMIRALMPDAKKIGILYTTSEANSLSTIETYKELAGNYGFEIVEKGISVSSDLPMATDSILAEVDCLTNLTDNNVVNNLALVLDKANAKGIPVFGSEVEQVKNGCVASEGIDYVKLGQQTGRMAAQVLKGEKKASEMNFETITEYYFYINPEVMEQFGLTIPEDFGQEAVDATAEA